jgi:hypothetical protein
MKIIALKGSEHSGKSHTINIVYTFLLKDDYKQEPNVFKILGDEKNEDVFDILVKGEIRIGIIGMGDYQVLVKLIAQMIQFNCNVIICACQNKIVDLLKDKYPTTIFIDKVLSTNKSLYRIDNVEYAKVLINNIN